MNIRSIAIDDEPIALSIINNFCNRKGGINLSTYCEPRIGLEAIEREKPDLVFLDIEMNSISGLDLAKRLPKECALIFTTAHAQFALEGFNLNAVDYLHKPFSYERFEQAVEKALRYLQPKETGNDALVVKQEYNNVIIPLNDILYLEAMENYTKIYRLSGNYILSRTNLKSLQQALPTENFIRIHKSFIVPISKISSYRNNQLLLNNNTALPIGRTYLNAVLQIIRQKAT